LQGPRHRTKSKSETVSKRLARPPTRSKSNETLRLRKHRLSRRKAPKLFMVTSTSRPKGLGKLTSTSRPKGPGKRSITKERFGVQEACKASNTYGEKDSSVYEDGPRQLTIQPKTCPAGFESKALSKWLSHRGSKSSTTYLLNGRHYRNIHAQQWTNLVYYLERLTARAATQIPLWYLWG